MKPNKDILIIPQPKQIILRKGNFRISPELQLFVNADNKLHVEQFLYHINAMGLAKMNIKILDTRKHVMIIANAMSITDIHKCKINNTQGYQLHIERNRICISSGGSAGLFYGIQTLLQILEDNKRPSLCTIKDWPDMEIRGVHFDLKGGMPTFSYLYNAVKRLAKYKINTILMEYEDKILFDKHPDLAGKSALTKKQAKEIDCIAREHHIQIIPLVQSLGHAEYILKHPGYRYLRETKDAIQQMCPSNPKTLAFFKQLCAEIFEIHPESKYFHIGGDETRQLGECSKCRKREKEIGKYRLYVEYIKKVCDYIIENDRIPVIWDDILTRHAPELLKVLPKQTVIMYWLYYIRNDKQNYCYAKDWILNSKQWTYKIYDYKEELPPGATNFIEELPEDEYREMKKNSGAKEFPRFFSSTIFLKKMQEEGHKVIGASAALCSKDGILPNIERALPNIKTWAKAIKKNKELGVVSTAWARSGGLTQVNGIMEGNWYPFLASAEYYWSAEKISEKEFDRKFCKRFYGLDNLNATDYIWQILHQHLAGGKEKLERQFKILGKKAIRHNENLYHYAVFSKVLQLKNEVESFFIDRLSRLKYMKEQTFVPARDLKGFNMQVKCFIKESIELKKRTQAICKKVIHHAEINDCIASYFTWCDYLLKIMSDPNAKI